MDGRTAAAAAAAAPGKVFTQEALLFQRLGSGRAQGRKTSRCDHDPGFPPALGCCSTTTRPSCFGLGCWRRRCWSFGCCSSRVQLFHESVKFLRKNGVFFTATEGHGSVVNKDDRRQTIYSVYKKIPARKSIWVPRSPYKGGSFEKIYLQSSSRCESFPCMCWGQFSHPPWMWSNRPLDLEKIPTAHPKLCCRLHFFPVVRGFSHDLCTYRSEPRAVNRWTLM